MKVPIAIPAGLQDWRSDGRPVLDQLTRLARANNNPDFGTTAARPTAQLTVGQPYFDTTLGKPVWWRGAAWVDATGAVV